LPAHSIPRLPTHIPPFSQSFRRGIPPDSLRESSAPAAGLLRPHPLSLRVHPRPRSSPQTRKRLQPRLKRTPFVEGRSKCHSCHSLETRGFVVWQEVYTGCPPVAIRGIPFRATLGSALDSIWIAWNHPIRRGKVVSGKAL